MAVITPIGISMGEKIVRDIRSQRTTKIEAAKQVVGMSTL